MTRSRSSQGGLVAGVFWLCADKLWSGDFSEALPEDDYLPSARLADCGEIDPMEDDFSAFVFKIQANMNKSSQRPYCIYAYLFRQI